MPRVPELNIDRTISSRVENEPLPRIGADTRQLQAIGAQALKIEDQLEKAQSSADALKTSNTLDKSLDTTMPKVEEIFSNIKNKKVDPDEGLKTINEMMDSFDADATGTITSSSVPDQASELYGNYVAPRIDKIRKEAQLLATTRKVANQKDSLVDDIAITQQKFIDGLVDVNDIQKLYQKIGDPAVTDLIGVDAQDKLLAEAGRRFASSATQFISAQGVTETNVATARSLIKNLPEAERLHATRNLDETIERAEKIGLQKIYAGHESFLKKYDSPKEIVENSYALTEMTSTLINSSLAKFETAEQRKDIFSRLMGKQIAAEAFMRNPTSVDIDPEQVNAMVESLTSNLTNREIASIFGGIDNLKSSVTGSVTQAMAEYNTMRLTNPVEYYAGMDEVVGKLLTSNNPEEIKNGVFQLADAYEKSDVPMSMRDIVSPSQAKDVAKTIKLFTEKGFDPTGKQLFGYVNNIASKYGDFSQVALLEYANKSKDFPASMIAVPRMADINNGMSVASGYANYEDYLDTLKDSKALSGTADPKRDYEKLVQEKVSSEMQSYISMTNGLPEYANPIYKSIRDSVQYMGVDIAIKSGSMNIESAINTAIQNIKEEFPTVSIGSDSLMIDAKYAASEKIDVDSLGDVLKSMKNLDFLEYMPQTQTSSKIDFEAVAKVFQYSPMAGTLKTISNIAKYDRVKANEMFRDTFEDQLVLSPDPAKPNHVAYYIKNRTAIVPVPAIGVGQSKRDVLSIPVGEYARKTKALKNTSTFGR